MPTVRSYPVHYRRSRGGGVGHLVLGATDLSLFDRAGNPVYSWDRDRARIKIWDTRRRVQIKSYRIELDSEADWMQLSGALLRSGQVALLRK